MISVIIPVYNHVKTLKRSVLSILKQTYRPLEIIIVNDGSTDNFDKAKKEIESINTDTEIKFFDQKNSGAPVARNKGFKESVGEYVIFWDADIIGQPKMLEIMCDTLQNNSKMSYSYSQFKIGLKKIKSHVFDADKLKENNYICTMSLIRRNDFPGFDESLVRFQDWDLWLTMLEQKKYGVFIPQVLFKSIIGFRKGISSWLPSFVYKLPWKSKKVKNYERLKEIVVKKHAIKK
jgi:teichuronic acid biosynthesis glycosyltransferase TuaG